MCSMDIRWGYTLLEDIKIITEISQPWLKWELIDIYVRLLNGAPHRPPLMKKQIISDFIIRIRRNYKQRRIWKKKDVLATVDRHEVKNLNSVENTSQ